MKKMVWMAVLGLVTVSAQANLLSNSGFETWWDSWSAWGNYTYNDSDSYMDNSGNLGGSMAGTLENTSGNPFQWSGFWQDGDIASIDPGDVFKASAYAKVQASTEYSFSAVKLEFYNGGTLVTAVTNAFDTLSSDSWTYNEVTGTAPSGVNGVRIGIFVDNITSAGDFYVDGASLIAVPEPGIAALLGLGILSIYAVRRKFRK